VSASCGDEVLLLFMLEQVYQAPRKHDAPLGIARVLDDEPAHPRYGPRQRRAETTTFVSLTYYISGVP
jgi:hypothetical protein